MGLVESGNKADSVRIKLTGWTLSWHPQRCGIYIERSTWIWLQEREISQHTPFFKNSLFWQIFLDRHLLQTIVIMTLIFKKKSKSPGHKGVVYSALKSTCLPCMRFQVWQSHHQGKGKAESSTNMRRSGSAGWSNASQTLT